MYYRAQNRYACQLLSGSWEADVDCMSSFLCAHLVALGNSLGYGETQSSHLGSGTTVPIMRAGGGNG